MSSKLNLLLTGLERIGLSPVATEFADMLWLAKHISSTRTVKKLALTTERIDPPTQSEKHGTPNQNIVSPNTHADNPEEKKSASQNETSQTQQSDIYAHQRDGQGSLPARAVPIPAVRNLPNSLLLSRALRQLKINQKSYRKKHFNEEKTAEFVAAYKLAKQHSLIPVYDDAYERLFELAVVIDIGKSMQIWQPVIADLKRLLQYHGAFSRVTVWYLDTDSTIASLYSKASVDNRWRCNVKDVVGVNSGRKLVWLLSDCVSNAWHSGSVTRLFSPLANHSVFAILQMLPPHMWWRSALGRGVDDRIYSNKNNKNLSTHVALGSNTSKHVFPVVCLDVESIRSWTYVVRQREHCWIHATSFTAKSKFAPQPLNIKSPSTEQIKKRIQNFLATSSDAVIRLAAYLATVPLSLPIMRMVQQFMLPNSPLTDLAEIYVSGLLRKEERHLGVTYDFYDGVRDVLLELVANSDIVKISECLSDYIDEHIGQALSFKALLIDPTASSDFLVNANTHYFATIYTRALRRLGGEYLKLAESVAAVQKYKPEQHQINKEETLEHDTSRPLNLVRAIFLGYGEAGKTSLVNVLNGRKVTQGDGMMTPSVDISNWSVPESELKALFWDFGGQVIAHATHQFFLRPNCLYVVVLNARSELNATEQADYWLEHVKCFGANAPVMIVGNKSDLAPLNLDMSYLTAKYPSIVDYYPLSCTQAFSSKKAEFERFYSEFCAQLREVGKYQLMFTNAQFRVVDSIRQLSLKQDFLTYRDYQSLCEQNGIYRDGALSQDVLLDMLDKLGVVFHFPQLPRLEKYVLNPAWLTHGVYTLIYAGQAKLTKKQVIHILQEKAKLNESSNVYQYPNDKCGFIMDVMQQFKLIYRLPNQPEVMIIPELLPTDQPQNISFDRNDALLFEFVFRGFLPRHIMPQLIVQRHTEIIEPYVWQQGVLLQSHSQQAQALIQVDYHDRVLSLWVKGRDAKDYLNILRDETYAIINLLDLNFDEYVALPAATRISDGKLKFGQIEKAAFEQIDAHIKAGKTEFIAASGAVYDVAKIFNILMPQAKGKVNAMNVLWVCALKDEFDELLKVTEGITGWQENTEADGWKVATTQLHTQHGRKLSLKATYSDRMGGDAVAARTAVLMASGEYCCVVMSGICAGRRGEVSLGDVVFAERVWKYDSGKIKVEDGEQRFQGDMLQYRPRPIWVQRMQGLKLQNTDFINARPKLPLEHQEDWVLQQVQAGNNPVATDMEALRKQHCPDWQAVLKRLRSKKLIEDKGLILTAHGVEYIEELLLNYPDGMPEPAAFKIHVAPMATGSAVTEDPKIFERLSASVRKILALEMEGSAMAALAEVHDVPVILAKGVSDYGDSYKDDRYRHFAARASAECVMALLRESGDLLGG